MPPFNDDAARDAFVGELRHMIAETLDAALADRLRAHAVALFAAGRDAEIPHALTRQRARDALERPGMLINVERAVLARVGLTDRVDDAGTGAHDGTG